MTAVPDGVEATLLLAGGQASGNAGCNRFSGDYTLDGPALTFQQFAVTRIACADPEVGIVEDAFMALLPTTTAWQSSDGTLQLLDADDGVILEFDQAEPDIADVIALLESLEAEVTELRMRVEALESGAAPGDGGDGAGTDDQAAAKPTAPRARGSVDTVFPEWMRDGLPPDQIENLNRDVVRWRDRADDEDGYRVYARRGFCELKPGTNPNQALDEADFRLARGKAVRIDRLPVDTTRYRPDHAAIDAALPEMPESPYSNDQFYDLFVSAFNEAGESKRVKVASFFLTPEFRCP
jgi:hypothetical protein